MRGLREGERDAGSSDVAVPQDALTREAEALARCRAGDRDAFRILIVLHERAVSATIARILLHPQETEDAVQETFIRAYQMLATFRAESSFRTWLCRIAVNLSLRRLDRLRRKGWLPLDEIAGPVALSPSDGPERQALQGEARRALVSALARLSDVHRAVVTLHYFEEKSCAEIADILGCSVGTVWSRLHYALKRLKALLPEEEPA